MSKSEPPDRSGRLYRWLLALYSRRLRDDFGGDMAESFDDWVRDATRQGGRWALPRLWASALLDLARTAIPDRYAARRPSRLDLHLAPGNKLRGEKAAHMETFLQDIRYGARSLLRAPTFAIVTIGTMAIGIAATTTTFSVGNGLLLRTPSGLREPGELVTAHRIASDGSGFHAFSITDFRRLREASASMLSLKAFSTEGASVIVAGEPVVLPAMIVSGSYFDVLGTRPQLGRFFLPEEDRVPGERPVVVLSHSAWQSSLAADPNIIGSDLTINGSVFTVVGIAEEGFRGHLAVFETDLWTTVASQGLIKGSTDLSESTAGIGLESIARLAPGTTRVQAQERLSVLLRQLAAERDVDDAERWGVDLRPYSPIFAQIRGGLIAFLALLGLVAGMLLAITAMNAANMLLSRALSRGREIGVRLAIGATRKRVIRQLLTESALLFLVGGAVGVLLTWWATRALAAAELPIPIPLSLDFHPDLRVLGFSLTISIGTALVFGLAPALHATRGDLAGALKEGNQAAGFGGSARHRLRNTLVVAQVAGAVVLLVGAGLLLRALSRADSIDIGFEPTAVRALDIDLALTHTSDEESVFFYSELRDRLDVMPGVESHALISFVPLSGGNQGSVFTIPGRPLEPEDGIRRTDYAAITPGYLETMGIALLAGRDFNDADAAGGPFVGIVNEAIASAIWPNESPIGKRVGFGRIEDGWDVEIVGLARDAKYRTLGDESRFMYYAPFSQFPESEMTLLARLAVDSDEAAQALRYLVRELQPALPVTAARPLAEVIGLSLLPNQIAAGMAGGFGGVGLLLAAIGLYGVLAYSVTHRTREIGIRIALGAGQHNVQRLVVRNGLRLTAIGLIIGLALAVGLGFAMRSMLFGVSPVDPITFAGLALVMIAVSAMACWLPARRAAAIDPLEALRSE